MKRSTLILLMLFISNGIYGYTWDLISPPGITVNNYLSSFNGDILSTPEGVLIGLGSEWIEYSTNLPVWGVLELDSENILVIMGNGSYSDGIYKLNLITQQFEVLEWLREPNFILYCFADSTYYTGSKYGLFTSSDGIQWIEVELFINEECRDMTYRGDNFILATSTRIWTSSDCGENWIQIPQGTPYLSSLTFDSMGNLYGIFPDYSNSSGLWSSADYGKTWKVEAWADAMQCVHYTFEHIFVGWENESGGGKGIAIWFPDTKEFMFLNEGLPCTKINKLSHNTLIDCYNIVACTDSGAYMTCDFPFVSVELISFNARILNDEVELTWSISHSSKVRSFNIEKSDNNINFEMIGSVYSQIIHRYPELYKFIDKDLVNGMNYYRLNMQNFSGTSEYSETIQVTFEEPVSYYITQNYPNPFTKIKFSLPEESNVKLMIFNALGEKIAELEHGNKTAGYYEKEWNAENFPSGVYLLKFEAKSLESMGKFNQTRKLVLIK